MDMPAAKVRLATRSVGQEGRFTVVLSNATAGPTLKSRARIARRGNRPFRKDLPCRSVMALDDSKLQLKKRDPATEDLVTTL